MDKTATIGSLTSAAIFSTGVVIAIANSIRIKTAEGAPWWRFWSLIPHGIYGGFAIQAAFHTRYDSNGMQSKLGPIFVSQSIHGMAGILLLPWTLAVKALCKKLKNNTAWPHSLEWGAKQRSSGFLYIFLIDASFLACILAAIIYGTYFTPWTFNTCSLYMAYDQWPPVISDASFQDQCRRGTAIQRIISLQHRPHSPPNFHAQPAPSPNLLPLSGRNATQKGSQTARLLVRPGENAPPRKGGPRALCTTTSTAIRPHRQSLVHPLTRR
ncbi:hypothetical protein VFPPC_04925 [Pochonia chlamydosporia 170]|uniref:Uncharacterized protein n=1 Tax=Pochonia chlamydosporia 170 TaxID=1380566 RepID=A0A179FT06_METCM|nr:hypothetical protein VFPPC_04925 [Pochonia chlamydosporia 170]OAQ68724.1 hypothetical protein VFPPC_04925 [Pochonia chlamydosporia 170]